MSIELALFFQVKSCTCEILLYSYHIGDTSGAKCWWQQLQDEESSLLLLHLVPFSRETFIIKEICEAFSDSNAIIPCT